MDEKKKVCTKKRAEEIKKTVDETVEGPEVATTKPHMGIPKAVFVVGNQF